MTSHLTTARVIGLYLEPTIGIGSSKLEMPTSHSAGQTQNLLAAYPVWQFFR